MMKNAHYRFARISARPSQKNKNLSSFLSCLFLWNIVLTEDENEFHANSSRYDKFDVKELPPATERLHFVIQLI